jgi:hypothetical protein
MLRSAVLGTRSMVGPGAPALIKKLRDGYLADIPADTLH